MRAATDGEAERLVYREARLLDEKSFDAWLDLYDEDAVYWMPAWRDDGTQTEDPARELSLIYYRGRRNLGDRVWRLRSGQSLASQLPARTTHIVANVYVDGRADDLVTVKSSFVVHRFDPRNDRSDAFFGTYTHDLRIVDDGLRIARKVIRLQNDVIPTVLDVNSI